MWKDWLNKNGKHYAEIIGFIFLSFIVFCILRYAVRFYLFGKCSFRTFSYFKFVQKRKRRSRHVFDSQSLQVVPPNKKWRISNEVVSLIHSVISGFWAFYAVAMYPNLIFEMNTYVHENPLGLIYLSFGYLLHDLIDLIINECSYRIFELLFHHVIVITAFLTTLTSRMFLGVVVFGLLMELNSIFLHTRSLMNLYGQPKNSTLFKFVALFNILTFIVFRMTVSCYLIYWQFSNAFSMKWYLYLISFFVIISLAITNSVLLFRVLAADGLLGKKRLRQPINTEKKENILAILVDTEDDLNQKIEDDSSDFDYYDNNINENSKKNNKPHCCKSASIATQTTNKEILLLHKAENNKKRNSQISLKAIEKNSDTTGNVINIAED